MVSALIIIGDAEGNSCLHNLQPTDRIEFGFVLLPDKSQMTQLIKLRDQIATHFAKAPLNPANPIHGTYINKPTTLPHVSVGQYGLLAMEIQKLIDITKEVAARTPILKESMAPALSITVENIFFDTANTREETNPIIVDLYRKLREKYMERIYFKLMITQALIAKLENKNNLEELTLIKKYYQNWGIPEGNRIRPHFTMIYNYTISKEQLETAFAADVALKDMLQKLRTITFTRLAIVQIDFWGNPLENGIIAEFPLAG